MGGATIWPVPRALDAEANYYPKKWKRNFLFLYGGLFLTGIQIQRYGLLCRVSTKIQKQAGSYFLSFIVIDDAHWRIHGLGKQRCTQACQVRGCLKFQARTHQCNYLQKTRTRTKFCPYI